MFTTRDNTWNAASVEEKETAKTEVRKDICRIKDQKYSLEERNKVSNDLKQCFLGSIAKSEIETTTFMNCIAEGIIWCNIEDLGTTKSVKISPVTGKIIMDNDGSCVANLKGAYASEKSSYLAELQNYSASENNGAVYEPIFFDIRKLYEN